MFDIPTVPTSDELLDKAFRRALRARGGKEKRSHAEEIMIRTASDILVNNLKNIVRKFPNFEQVSQFYRETIDVVIGIDNLRISLSSVNWASGKIHQIARSALIKIRRGQNSKIVRKQTYGRIASIMKEIKYDLDFLNTARNKIKDLPHITDEPTILVAGYPNVGKSSFVSFVTHAKPEIAQYPFTTKGIVVGHIEYLGRRYQVIDLPGLLDRPVAKRNVIERQAISALKHLGDAVLFILDPTETCGYPVTDQLKLLAELKLQFSIPFIVASNKADLNPALTGLEMYQISTRDGQGVSQVLKALIKALS
ncbi:MAG TPA: GTPase [Candidatus Acidoferrales bacterium]|nr:GTPase [Candidatus Acidoferrales bacterium]